MVAKLKVNVQGKTIAGVYKDRPTILGCRLWVHVTDENDSPVTGLTKDSFTVYTDGELGGYYEAPINFEVPTPKLKLGTQGVYLLQINEVGGVHRGGFVFAVIVERSMPAKPPNPNFIIHGTGLATIIKLAGTDP